MSARRVIVGVADLDRSRAALDWAATQAAADGQDLVVAHATAAVPGVPGGDRTLARALVAARKLLATDRIQPVVRSGAAGVALVELAYAEDILVIGAPSHRRWLHARSTTRFLLGHAPCPVIVVAPPSVFAARRSEVSPGKLAGGQVVVGVGGPGLTPTALSFAFAYAARHRLSLVAIHVSPRPGPAAERTLAGQVERFEREYPRLPVRRLVLAGRIVPALAGAADAAALLVAGTSGVRLGASVARGLVDASVCPLAVIRHA